MRRAESSDRPEHKNKARAPIRPLNVSTLGLSVFGLGFMRPAPGTWGSMPPCAVALALLVMGAEALAWNVMLLGVLAGASLVCVAFGGYAETRFGRKDAAEVVADETAGVCLPLMLWPDWVRGACTVDPGEGRLIWPLVNAAAAVGAAFVLFRLFDIFKPWPARRLERLPRGWGVLVDDVVAGVYAAVVMQVGFFVLMRAG